MDTPTTPKHVEPPEPWWRKASKSLRRNVKVMSKRFLLGAAYASGSGCVTLLILWAQHK
ncbi:hypothetical protein ACGFZU_35330 [Streptomyces tendae]|uniref:hypothetical protein n=1 Tax=Streptomyces tendae TaxID=1932 RepID=UPI00371072C6